MCSQYNKYVLQKLQVITKEQASFKNINHKLYFVTTQNCNGDNKEIQDRDRVITYP